MSGARDDGRIALCMAAGVQRTAPRRSKAHRAGGSSGTGRPTRQARKVKAPRRAFAEPTADAVSPGARYSGRMILLAIILILLFGGFGFLYHAVWLGLLIAGVLFVAAVINHNDHNRPL